MTELDQRPGSPSPTGHGWFDVDADRRGRNLQAVCECGWKSPPSHAGGLAGALWDLHVEDEIEPSGPFALLAELEASLDRSEASLQMGHRSLSEVERGGPDTCVAVDGERDASTDPALRALLFDLVARNPGCTVLVDMSAVTFMDSTALSTLIMSKRRAHSTGGDLRVSDPSPRVRSLLDLSGTSRILLRDP